MHLTLGIRRAESQGRAITTKLGKRSGLGGKVHTRVLVAVFGLVGVHVDHRDVNRVPRRGTLANSRSLRWRKCRGARRGGSGRPRGDLLGEPVHLRCKAGEVLTLRLSDRNAGLQLGERGVDTRNLVLNRSLNLVDCGVELVIEGIDLGVDFTVDPVDRRFHFLE